MHCCSANAGFKLQHLGGPGVDEHVTRRGKVDFAGAGDLQSLKGAHFSTGHAVEESGRPHATSRCDSSHTARRETLHEEATSIANVLTIEASVQSPHRSKRTQRVPKEAAPWP
jgi:hypothetical protein